VIPKRKYESQKTIGDVKLISTEVTNNEVLKHIKEEVKGFEAGLKKLSKDHLSSNEFLDSIRGQLDCKHEETQIKRYEKFKQEFDKEAALWLSDDDLQEVVVTDGSFDDYRVEPIRELMQLCPWGQGFPEPLFDDEFEIIEQKIVAGKHLK